MYQATFDEIWLNRADLLVQYSLEHFFDSKSGMFYFTSKLDPKLVARKMEINDNTKFKYIKMALITNLTYRLPTNQ